MISNYNFRAKMPLNRLQTTCGKAFSENPFLAAAAALVIYNRMNIAVFRDSTPKITFTFLWQNQSRLT